MRPIGLLLLDICTCLGKVSYHISEAGIKEGSLPGGVTSELLCAQTPFVYGNQPARPPEQCLNFMSTW